MRIMRHKLPTFDPRVILDLQPLPVCPTSTILLLSMRLVQIPVALCHSSIVTAPKLRHVTMPLTANRLSKGSVARANFLPYGRDFINGNRRGPTGRFSNGKILPDLLAENFGLPFPLPYNNPTATGAAIVQGINTASAGSGWLNDTSSALVSYPPSGGVIPGTQHVQWVKKWQQSLVTQVGASRATTIVQESPYLINISDNDILAYFESTELQQQYTEEQYRKLIIDTAVSNIKDLYSGGGRKFAVTSVSARGCSPGQITRALFQAASSFSPILSASLWIFSSTQVNMPAVEFRHVWMRGVKTERSRGTVDLFLL
ncbi:hypothetical protein R1flu_000417 [Riccia fluitans]|uniref:GDSL esterase/lipase n=1 Tax=Riccia fluitans TaxID=41844 RepID=A0ABD1Y3C7_9MARC